jgi:AAA+ superfamily predicted ATPase
MAGNFTIKSKNNLDDIEVGSRIEESDYCTITPGGNFVQFEYHEEVEDCQRNIDIKPGIWCVVKKNNELRVETTDFNQDKILDQYVKTKEVEDCIDCFFQNLHLYPEFGIELPKRNLLLYGPAGSGKSTALTQIVKKYANLHDTAILVWHTSVWDSYDMKRLIKRLNYLNVNKLILIAEDLGGIEQADARKASDSSLLSLLDNAEKVFIIPTCIIATTNYPEMFMANIGDRPGRFDDKIEIGFPDKDARVTLLKFFTKDTADEESIKLIQSKECSNFTPAHIRESYIRSRLKSKKLSDCIKEIVKEQKKYSKGFTEFQSTGLGFGE